MNADSISKISKVVAGIDDIFSDWKTLCLGCAEPRDVKKIDWEIQLSLLLGSNGINMLQLALKLGESYYLDGENVIRWKGGCVSVRRIVEAVAAALDENERFSKPEIDEFPPPKPKRDGLK